MEADAADGETVEARKQRRRERIEQQLKQELESANPALRAEKAKTLDVGEGRQRVASSLGLLDQTKSRSIDYTTAVRVEIDKRENMRQLDEERKRRERLVSLQEEAIQSSRQNAAVEMKWASLGELTMPRELWTEIVAQKRACAKILSAKDRLITEFRDALRGKDDDYVASVQRQGEEVDTLLDRMAKQFKELQFAYERELQSIEEAFVRERASLIRANRTEMNELFDKHKNMELSGAERRQEREAEFMDSMDRMRNETAEQYAQLKIKLEQEVQTLEQQLASMKATYLLNQEKLEYNFRVLTERDAENNATIAAQKKRIARLKEALSSMMTRYGKDDAEYRATNAELTSEYDKITKQFAELQRKFVHFQQVDNQQVQDIWDMHEADLMALREKVVTADRLIHEQILGYRWRPPPPPVNPFQALMEGKLAQSQGQRRGGTAAPGVPSSGASEGDSVGPTGAMRLVQDEDPETLLLTRKTRRMLELLTDEASFLLDEETIQGLVHARSKDEAAVLRAEALFAVLGVETQEDVAQLVDYFFNETEQEPEEGEDIDQLVEVNIKVKREEVVRALQRFVAEREQARQESMVLGARRKESAAKQAAQARKMRVAKMEADYWAQVARATPALTHRALQHLERLQGKYLHLLEARASAIGEVDALHKANEELKTVLNQFFSGRVNDELYIPPAQTIRIGPGPGPATKRA